MTRFDVTAIGEGQLRFTTPNGIPLEQAGQLQVTVAGTEGNVLGLLARLGNRTGIVTCLPSTALGRRVASEYRSAGIDTTAITWRDDGRVALYFVDQGIPPVPSNVLYDRADSCFVGMSDTDVDWDYLGDGRLLHMSGITAALGDEMLALITRAHARARERGQLVSIDVNHRVHLWSAELALDRLTPLVTGADVLFCSRRDATSIFGIKGDATQVAETLSARFGAGTVLVSDGSGRAAATSQGRSVTADPPATTVLDRVGAGDALVAGFLHGYLRDDPESGLRFGIAAAALALTRHGDQVHTSLDDLERLANSFGADIVR